MAVCRSLQVVLLLSSRVSVGVPVVSGKCRLSLVVETTNQRRWRVSPWQVGLRPRRDSSIHGVGGVGGVGGDAVEQGQVSTRPSFSTRLSMLDDAMMFGLPSLLIEEPFQCPNEMASIAR